MVELANGLSSQEIVREFSGYERQASGLGNCITIEQKCFFSLCEPLRKIKMHGNCANRLRSPPEAQHTHATKKAFKQKRQRGRKINFIPFLAPGTIFIFGNSLKNRSCRQRKREKRCIECLEEIAAEDIKKKRTARA